MSRQAAILLLSAGAVGAAPLHAAAYTFNGLVDLRAGFANNPGLTRLGGGNSGFVGGSVSGSVRRATSLSSTVFTGVADLTENFRNYGLLDNYNATIQHNQQVTEHLTLTGDLGYQNSINNVGSFSPFGEFGSFGSNGLPLIPFVPDTTVQTTPTTSAGGAATDTAVPVVTLPIGIYDPTYTDYLAIGSRTERIYGDGGANWMFGARDALNLGGNYAHGTYGGRFANDYDQYGAYVGYQRTINARTRVGVQLSRQWYHTANSPTSYSDQVSLTLYRQISARWTLNGSVGVFNQRSRGPSRFSSRTVSLNAALCGNYTRINVCFTGYRQSAPSGIGGLRIATNFGTNLSYRLTEHSTLNAAANYDHSAAGGSVIPRQDFYSLQTGYSRTLTRRISLGGTGRYYRRSFGDASAQVGAGHQQGWAVSGDVLYRFGRQ